MVNSSEFHPVCPCVSRDGEDLDSQGDGSSQPDTISIASRTSQNTLDSDKVGAGGLGCPARSDLAPLQPLTPLLALGEGLSAVSMLGLVSFSISGIVCRAEFIPLGH